MPVKLRLSEFLSWSQNTRFWLQHHTYRGAISRLFSLTTCGLGPQHTLLNKPTVLCFTYLSFLVAAHLAASSADTARLPLMSILQRVDRERVLKSLKRRLLIMILCWKSVKRRLEQLEVGRSEQFSKTAAEIKQVSSLFRISTTKRY